MIPPLVSIFAWPFMSAFFFRKYSLTVAILATLIGGFLFLPSNRGLDLPLLPEFDKVAVPALVALFFAWRYSVGRNQSHMLKGIWVRSVFGWLLLAATVIGAFLTVLTNGDTQVYGYRVLEGMRPYDGFSAVLSTIIILIPVVLGRKFFAYPFQQKTLLFALCVTGLAYSLLALFEIRMSPQLNSTVYGYFPHSWRQHMRGGGFRPLVFLEHGLILATFLFMTILAGFGLARIDKKRKALFICAGFWLLGTLVLAKSLGALLITLLMLPAVIFLPVRAQLMAAAAIATICLSYPALRGAQLVPLDAIEQLAASIDDDRAHSLRVRLDNEELLLNRLAERPIFGWGGWGRQRVFDQTGRDLVLLDGYWIIIFGAGGWVRYLAEFGLIATPVIALFLRAKRFNLGFETSVLTLILAGNMIDLIPNSAATPLMWLIVGSLWGRLELGQVTEADTSGQFDSASIPASLRETTAAKTNPYTRQTERIDR